MNIVVITLLMVLLNPDYTSRMITKEFRGGDAMQECKAAEAYARDAVKQSGALDVGTICVKSEFDDNIKPRV